MTEHSHETAPHSHAATAEELRDIADVAAVGSSPPAHPMSAAAVKVGLAETRDGQYQDREARKLINALAGLSPPPEIGTSTRRCATACARCSWPSPGAARCARRSPGQYTGRVS